MRALDRTSCDAGHTRDHKPGFIRAIREIRN
jgi:hypothetical protein